MFSTDKGRLHLASQAGYQRLVVTSLSSGHTYEDMEAIKAELSVKVLELAPAGSNKRTQKVTFTSVLIILLRNVP